MDDFSVFGPSFDLCLKILDTILNWCVESNLVINWEKCNFMVTEGIILCHKISSKGIKVEKAKVEVIEKLPPPLNIKGIRSFLGHAGFYRRFITMKNTYNNGYETHIITVARLLLDSVWLYVGGSHKGRVTIVISKVACYLSQQLY